MLPRASPLGLRGAWACVGLGHISASAFHRTTQVSQLHLPSMPMRQSIENALQTGELASELVTPCVCVCVCAACRRTEGWSRERALAQSARTHTAAAACPLAVSPASRQLRPQSAANSSLGHACGWQLKPRPCVRLAMGRGAPLVSMIARGVDRAFLSSHCRSVYPRRPAGGLSSSRRPSRSSSRAHCDRGGPGLRHSVRDGEIVELDFSRFPGIAK